ncbi:MAG: hypothetical protein LVR00_07905 [Rhabdochlamydiaceae bacterium]|jgi:hypothetical protein
MWEFAVPLDAEPLGYKKLVELFTLESIPHFRWSYASLKWDTKELHFDNARISLYIYPCSYRLPNDVFEHLEFALKHEGVNLYILKQVLEKISHADFTKYLAGKLTRKYVRILWFLYENFNHIKLPVPDLKQGSYVALLDPKKYYISDKPRRSNRHRVADNLLGTLHFTPIVRKTVLLNNYEKSELGQKSS